METNVYIGVNIVDVLRLHQRTGQSCYVSFTAANLRPLVDNILSEKLCRPHQLIVVSDDKSLDAAKAISEEMKLTCLVPGMAFHLEAASNEQ